MKNVKNIYIGIVGAFILLLGPMMAQAVTPYFISQGGTATSTFYGGGFLYSNGGTNPIRAIASSTAGFANTALSNLASTSVNTDILPDTTLSWNLGSDTFRWNDVITGSIHVGQTFSTGSFVGGALDSTLTTSFSNLGTVNSGQWQGTAISVAKGGTAFTGYTTGDLIQANSAFTLAKLNSVSAGSFLRSGGVSTISSWSTTKWTNSATTGDLLYASASNTYSNLAGVATGNALISGGVTTAPSWGKITSAHVDSSVITTAITTGGANPSASVGLSAVNGSALSFMRSDGAPALSQAITPVWTALHKWNTASGGQGHFGQTAVYSTNANAALTASLANSTTGSYGLYLQQETAVGAETVYPIAFGTGGTDRTWSIDNYGVERGNGLIIGDNTGAVYPLNVYQTGLKINLAGSTLLDMVSGDATRAMLRFGKNDLSLFVYMGVQYDQGYAAYQFWNSAGTTATPMFTINDNVNNGNGNVGIASTTPYARLSVKGTAGIDPFAVASSTNGFLLGMDKDGHNYTGGTAPTLSSCGTSPSISGDDNTGVVTAGSVSATGCTITFSRPWANAPSCTISNRSMSVVNAMTYTVSTTTIVISQTGFTGDLVDYQCVMHK